MSTKENHLVKNYVGNEEECRAVVVECRRTKCEWFDECARKRRQLYI